MNLKRTLLSTAVLVTGLASAPAFADLTPITGFYFGALGGQTDYGQSRGAFDAIVIATVQDAGFDVVDGFSELDNEDIGFGAFAGYRIWDYFAVEALYVDIGEMKYNADIILSDGVNNDIPADFELTQSINGPALALVGILPFDGPWEVYARAGMLFGDTEFCARASIDGGTPGEVCDSESSEETLAGVGFGFHIGDHISVRAEYTKIFDVGSEEDEMEEDVNFINLHFVWRL
jgi:hypothetical protein